MHESVTPTEWAARQYPELPAESITKRTFENAYLSASDSGHIYWDNPTPRGYVRGAVHESNGRLVAESQRKGGMGGDMVISTNPAALSKREKDEAADNHINGHWLYAGTWMYGFGHFLIETLPALWPLLEQDAKFDGIAAHRFNFNQVHQWQNDIVELIFPGPIHVVREGPATVDKITVPVRPSQYQDHISPVAAQVWDAIAEKAGRGPSQSVFLSRTQFEAKQPTSTRGRGYANSEAVDDLFRSHGFRVISPETMNVLEQIEAVSGADCIAGQGGSALHLSVFAKPGAKVVELGDSRTRENLVNTQRAISFAKRQPTAHIPYVEDAGKHFDLSHIEKHLVSLGL